jgi:fructose 1,6-bisphosphate aldolase/phosphatase
MAVPHNTGCSYFDGPPIVSCWGFCVKNGRLTESVDLFDHPFWNTVRTRASEKAIEIRRQGFSGPAMLSYSELEYGGIVRILEKLDSRFTIRHAERVAEAAMT